MWSGLRLPEFSFQAAVISGRLLESSVFGGLKIINLQSFYHFVECFKMYLF